MDYEDKALISVYDDIGKSIINPQASITEALDKNKNYMLKIIEDYMIPNYNAVYGE